MDSVVTVEFPCGFACKGAIGVVRIGGHGNTSSNRADPGEPAERPHVARRRGLGGPSGIVLDDVSKAIIEQLQQDGRRPYATIAKAVGLSEAAVRQRVQRLLDAGVMQIVAVTDPMTLGFLRWAMIGIRADGDLQPGRRPARGAARGRLRRHHRRLVRPARRGRLRGRRAPAPAAQRSHPLHPADPAQRDLRLPATGQADLHLGHPMTTTPQTPPPSGRAVPVSTTRLATVTCRRPPAATCGCTSPGCRPTPTTRSRSSPAARARTSGTPAAGATSTGCPGCSWCRSVTAAASWPTRPASRPTSSPTSRCGATRTRPRSSWPSGSRLVRAGRPQPGVLHHRRRRGGRERLEAGPPVLQGDRRARPATR